MPRSENFSVTNKTRGKTPRLPFALIKATVIGKKYQISLVFIEGKTSRLLNLKHRAKNRPANVLSFPLEKNSGEIFIAPATAKAEAAHFNTTGQKFIGRLFIHGLLHLKGQQHGSRMEAAEQKYLKKFKL